MIVRADLTKELKLAVRLVEDDLRVRADSVDEVGLVVHSEFVGASEAGRTAHDEVTWREGLFAQVAVAWVLAGVFIRFCEDNGLLGEDPPDGLRLSGVGEKRRWAADGQRDFFRENQSAGERDYLTSLHRSASGLLGLDEVFGSHSPLWLFGPSDDACRALIERWRATDPESGGLVWDFTDPAGDTRFLGDLYQDLSDHAKKTFALLQTPDFVEGFILDRTLEPALAEFGLDGHSGEGFRVIDPACGSGHFLLGAFERLAERQLAADPGGGRRAAAGAALDCVFGVDINPFAVSIARFRLLVAALRFAEIETLVDAPRFGIHVAVGDSLLHGPTMAGVDAGIAGLDAVSADRRHLYETEDGDRVRKYLWQKYDAVVANPPYITPKDPAANASYRALFTTTHRQYSLSVPFMERLFDLAARGSGRSGFVGQITANSFMKREFGKKMVQDYLGSEVDLTAVVDTSGAYIPGHGTPTVILFGRNRFPVGEQVRAVMGIRGEPSAPKVPADGLVWSSIVDLIDRPGAENDYVSVNDIERKVLSKHPWSLQGGAAGPLAERIESGRDRLAITTGDIGRTTVVGDDDAWLMPISAARRKLVLDSTVEFVTGTNVRDFAIEATTYAIYPYDSLGGQPSIAPAVERSLWPNKNLLSNRTVFGKRLTERGEWYEHLEHYASRLKTPLSIAFAFVATHNHFVLDRGGKVFNRSAPVIKLPVGASVDDHLQLLGLLNSSTACFWMQQVFHNKGGPGGGSSKDEKWHDFYEFDGTKLKRFPVVEGSVLDWARALDDLASELAGVLPAGVCAAGVPSAEALERSEAEVASLRARMVWLQEELDWRCAFLYGVTDDDLSLPVSEVFELERGERAFEIALARKAENGSVTTRWFSHIGVTPITELPEHWSGEYRSVVERRLELIGSDRFVGLLERPEYKRRWNWDSWADLATVALRGWLLDRLESPSVWPGRQAQSVNQLADRLRVDGEFMQVAALYVGSPEFDVSKLVGELTAEEVVPFLAALRYKPSGLRKRASWESTWDLQRREDAGEDVGRIPVPPKYGSADFVKPSFWKLRGKLDVPKERFVSYPGVERDVDGSAVIGWAGWDHLEQAEALVWLLGQRREVDGWGSERLVPLLAGLGELVPWLRQWHNDYDPDIGQGLGDYYADYLVGQARLVGLTVDELGEWRPEPKTNKKKATT